MLKQSDPATLFPFNLNFSNTRKRSAALLVVFAVGSVPCFAQGRKKPAAPPVASHAPAIAPPSVPAPPVAHKTGPQSYTQVITSKAITQHGMFLIHKVDDRFYFELPDSLLDRDVLVVNRISKAAAGTHGQMIGYAGDHIGQSVIRFESGPNHRIFLKTISYMAYSQDTTANGMYRSVRNSNLQPIAASFDVKAYRKDSVTRTHFTVIDVTEYISGDNDILFFDANVKKALFLGEVAADRSYVQDIKVYPMNVEIKTVKTYTKVLPPGPLGEESAGPATYELNSSLVLLPKVPMKARYFDPRVGYFSTGYVDFDANPQGIKDVSVITRWRLEPKEEDVDKYLRGELVEPKKPIIYYIDPATPKKWVPYLIQGINDWQGAFEKAGFKNAIIAKEAPVGDSTWSLEDATHNAVVYKPSDVANASGPNVHDPRSGEIIETHINWYHNVMSLLHNWYMIQAGAVDPKARTMQFTDSLMGQLIRFVSSHEVGHTLGLLHNFGASSTVPVEKVRNKAWLDAHGHTPSIMDYARFNYVAQPEDHIPEQDLFPRIGEYDRWAIEWGYKWNPGYKTAEAEKAWLNKWVIDSVSANKRLWFGAEEYVQMDPNACDPRRQNEDLGDNAMKAGRYGIKNLQRILKNLPVWTREPNEDYDDLAIMYKELVGQYYRYVGHVLKNIGGMLTTPKTVEQKGDVYEYVPAATQKQAMQFLKEQVFRTPAWLLDKAIFDKIGNQSVEVIGKIQEAVLGRLLSAPALDRLIDATALDGKKAYTVTDLFDGLNKSIWTELVTKKPVSLYRRNLQKLYVEKLIAIIHPVTPTFAPGMSAIPKTNDVLSVARVYAKLLVARMKAAASVEKDELSKWHLQDLTDRLTEALDPKK